MIEPKDASKNDKRQVKNTSNLLTQKRKGETHTMGNRGMTNWKLGAFFIMSLMLVAAVFSNTAMAAADDGKGSSNGTNGSSLTPVPVATDSASCGLMLQLPLASCGYMRLSLPAVSSMPCNLPYTA